MRLPKSKVGLTLSFLYLIVSTYLILSQGLFGESFIAILLGFPWSFMIVLGGINSVVSESNPLFSLFLYSWVLAPIIVNLVLFYWIGVGIQKLLFRKSSSSNDSLKELESDR